jgi:hypothetical protein
MEAFIEVIGQGVLTETVTEHRITLSVAVEAGGHDALSKAEALRARCVRILKESSIKDSELSEGGGVA